VTSPIWHPFTQHALIPDATLVTSGEGAWLETEKGRLLDAISSWWVITHGHRHPRIVEAIKQQADALDQVIFAGFTHQPAEDLARALLEIAPTGLSHVFYSDSGSTSVEVALKMALGFWKNRGSERTRIIALEHAYHGDTVGTMSAGARGVFTAAYQPLLFDVVRLPFPAPGREQQTLALLRDAAKDAAALIVEPLILGSGGMHIYPADVLRDMAAICRDTGTLMIADEVMTCFGRLCAGRRFSTRIFPPTAAALFSIPAPSPPTPSPARRRAPIWRFGRTNRCGSGLRHCRGGRRNAWRGFKTMRGLKKSAAWAPSPPWTSRSPIPAIWRMWPWNWPGSSRRGACCCAPWEIPFMPCRPIA
jgi:hypothetical protein